MTRILISGAGGFTGRHLAAALAADGHEVIGLFKDAPDALPEGLRSAVTADILDPQALLRVVEEVAPEYVAHLAAIAFVAHGNVEELYRTNIVGTRNLLEAVGRLSRRPAMTLLASSANIYGNADVELIDESTPAAPASDYAVSKLAMEYMAKLYAPRLPLVIARPFNYTGIGQAENFLIPKIVSHFRRGATEIELGNIDVARDFSDVRSVVRAYQKLLATPAAAGRTLNVCSGHSYTLREVLGMTEEIAGRRLAVRINPAFVRANEVRVLRGSPAALEALAGRIEPIPLRATLSWMLQAEE